MKAILQTEEHLFAKAVAHIRDGANPKFSDYVRVSFSHLVEVIDAERPTTLAELEAINTRLGTYTGILPYRCDGCGLESHRLVTVGNEPDYESATATLCLDCCREAWELISGAVLP